MRSVPPAVAGGSSPRVGSSPIEGSLVCFSRPLNGLHRPQHNSDRQNRRAIPLVRCADPAAPPQHIAERLRLSGTFPFLNRGYASAARRSLGNSSGSARRSGEAWPPCAAAKPLELEASWPIELHVLPFPIYYSTVMAKQRIRTEQWTATHADRKRHKPSRNYILSLRGKFKGKGLLKALMIEKHRERRSWTSASAKVHSSSPWNETITQTQSLGFEIPRPTRFLANSWQAAASLSNRLSATPGSKRLEF